MKSVFAYIRVSTQKQGTHGSSLQEQRTSIEAYAKKNNLAIGEWFEETETAAKRGRPAFTRMMRALAKGKAQGVVMHKIDRGARNFWDWAAIGDLIEKNVAVHFAHESLDLNTRGGRLAADIQAVVAADYIRNLKDEVRKGLYGRLKQGIYPLAAPIGYLDTGGGKPKDIDPLQGPLVRQAFELYASGEFNFHTLRTELNRRGLRTRTGKPLSLDSLTRILNNPFYIGIIHIKKTNETFQGKHQPLIPRALYDRAQSVLRGNRLAGAAWKHDFLFRRLIRCGTCKRTLIGERQKRRYVYYRCHQRTCGVVSLSEGKLKSRFLYAFELLRFDDVELGDFRDMLAVLRGTADDDRKQREIALRLALSKNDERLSRLTDALLDETLDKDMFEAKKSTLLAERRGLSDQLEDIASAPSKADHVAAYLELAITAYIQFKNGLIDEKRDMVVKATSNFAGSGNNPAITLKSPFQEMLEYRILQCSALHRDDGRTRAKRLFEMCVRAAERESSGANQDGVRAKSLMS